MQCGIYTAVADQHLKFYMCALLDLGLVVLSVEQTNCTGVATGVYKITVLAYLNVPNVTQTGSIISLLCLEEKKIKITAFQVLFIFFIECCLLSGSFMQGRKENIMPKILHEVKLENEDLFALPPVCFQCERDLTVHNSH